MKLTFTFFDAVQIFSSVYRAFISTFHYRSDKSDSDLSDFDQNIFGCGDVTPEVEKMVGNNWEICSPFDKVYGGTISNLIKETVNTATEETQCVGLKFFNDMTPGQDRNLIETCTGICYWCYCETIKKMSPIIAQASTNLMY